MKRRNRRGAEIRGRRGKEERFDESGNGEEGKDGEREGTRTDPVEAGGAAIAPVVAVVPSLTVTVKTATLPSVTIP